MKKEQINEINDSLLKKTGVDFSRYRNKELTDALANAVTFPFLTVFTIVALVSTAILYGGYVMMG